MPLRKSKAVRSISTRRSCITASRACRTGSTSSIVIPAAWSNPSPHGQRHGDGKTTRYTSGLDEYKRARRPALLGLRLLLYPPLAFAKLYFGKRYFLNGWAGYFAARTQAFYAFLKYAKLYEAGRKREDL